MMLVPRVDERAESRGEVFTPSALIIEAPGRKNLIGLTRLIKIRQSFAGSFAINAWRQSAVPICLDTTNEILLRWDT